MSKLDPAHQEATVMASELKPWRYEIKYGPEGEDAYSWVYDDHGAMVATMKTHKAKQIVDTMNTSPAPAATDTGLVTVAYQYKIPRNGHWDNLPSDWTADECKAYDKQETRELVTRSQAVELLAGERARYVEASQRATNEESLKDTMHRGLLRWKERAEKAEADNAAKDARIKDAETGRDRVKKIFKRNTQKRFEAESRSKILEAEVTAVRETLIDEQSHRLSLEAKLAAAEKALEFYADASKWDDGYFKSEDDGTVLRAYPSSVDKDQGDKARAVLGGKPS